ncbi:MAG: cytochrome c biogenesis protein CcdA [Candidatus Omnitrophota bacterium]|nr:cytochrome c biogenesis protein CcdA [Candidatus Omnitrophota bacterium]
MISHIFELLSNAIGGAPIIALAASFGWGVLSIILSPCHLASIPLIVGFINDQGVTSTKRAFLLSFFFASGILVTIGIIGGITASMGRMLGDIGAGANYFVAAVFVFVGLHLLGIVPFPFMGGTHQPGIKKKGLLAALLLGLIFGIALGPCTFAYMAPVIAVTLSVASTKFFYGILLLLAYGLGHCSVIVAAGTSTEAVENYLKWNERSKGVVVIKKICGILIIIAAVYFILKR